MKKILTILSIFIFVLSLASCNRKKPSVETSGYFETPEISTNDSKSNISAVKTHFDNCVKNDGPFNSCGIASIGCPNVLVIPINLDESKKTDEILNDIKIAFCGTKEETGWYSVHDYYYESSYEKLDFKFDVLNEWYTPKYEALDYKYDGASALLVEALNYYDDKIDFNKYDNDSDGAIDSIWLIYNYPVVEDSDMYWSYVDRHSFSFEYDGVVPNYFGFAGIDFMYKNENIKIDSHMYIHETGHMLNLDDYYDYSDVIGYKYNVYQADMMCNNYGDHCSISKLLLGWIDPIVISGSGSINIDLTTFTTTGNCILIANHTLYSIYDEYFLIEYYKNEGLNEFDTPILNLDNKQASGIRILHVDAHQQSDDNGKACYKYNNSYSLKPFVEMLKADFIENDLSRATANSLYVKKMTFGNDIWSSFKLNDESNLFFTIDVNELTASEAKLTINVKEGL